MPKNIREAENVIAEKVKTFSGIADDRPLRVNMLESSGILEYLKKNTMMTGFDGVERAMSLDEAIPLVGSEQRRKNLAPLGHHIAKIVESSRMMTGKSWKNMRDAYNRLKKGKNVGDQRDNIDFFGADPIFRAAEDNTDLVFGSILKEPVEGRELLNEIDRLVEAKSEALIKEMDELEAVGQRKKISCAFVGDGLNTSTALSAVGSLTENIVISRQEELASDWRYNPIFINSSSIIGNIFAKALPLLKGCTTGIVPSGFLGGVIRAADLLSKSALVVRFKTKILGPDGEMQRKGRTKKFLSGQILGRGAAVNIFGNADNFLMHHEVIPKLTRLRSNGIKTIVMRDTRTNKLRELDVETCMFLTGPGKEKLAIKDLETQRLYSDAVENVDQLITQVEKQKKEGDRIRFEIPRILTLTSIRKLYRMWDKTLNRDPRYYPFKELIREGKVIGHVGGGDTTRTMTELCAGRGPRESYPDDFDFTSLPRQLLYNVAEKTRQQYNLNNRTRYWGVVSENVTTKAEKVKRIGRVADNVRLGVQSEDGVIKLFDYVFVSTGFEREAIEVELDKAGIPIFDYQDNEGKVVGLGNKALGILINGPATGFGKNKFPTQIQGVIEALGIKENTVALWVYQILVTRMLWTHFSKSGISINKVDNLLQEALLRSPDALFAETEASQI